MLMKRTLVFLLSLFILAAIPLAAHADARRYTPPPSQGVIFVIVSFKGYSSRNIVNRGTKVEVSWGNFRRSDRFSPRPAGMAGVVIRLRHDNRDSVPLLVNTDGNIQYVGQTSRPPQMYGFYQVDW